MKRTLALVLLGALSGGALWAADPWKEKNYTEWSEKEIRKVLGRSPWAKTVTLSLSPGSEFGLGAGSGRQPGGYGTQRPRSRSLELLVRWHSALPVRQAFTCLQVAAEQMSPEQAEQLIQQTSNQYVVTVSGIPMAAMGGMAPAKLKASSYLKIGRVQRIMVQDVRMSQGRVRDFFFVFPRAIPIELRHKSGRVCHQTRPA